jgi:hypothetical protein
MCFSFSLLIFLIPQFDQNFFHWRCYLIRRHLKSNNNRKNKISFLGFYLTFGFNFIDFVKLSFLLEVKTAILFRTWIKEMHIFCKSWVIKPSHGIKQTKLIITTKKLRKYKRKIAVCNYNTWWFDVQMPNLVCNNKKIRIKYLIFFRFYSVKKLFLFRECIFCLKEFNLLSWTFSEVSQDIFYHIFGWLCPGLFGQWERKRQFSKKVLISAWFSFSFLTSFWY